MQATNQVNSIDPQIFRANFAKTVTNRKANKPTIPPNRLNELAANQIKKYATDYFNPNMKLIIAFHYGTLDEGYIQLRRAGIIT